MTEVPEHLLRRSKERRAAIGGGGGDEPPATPGEAPGTGAAARAVGPAGGTEVAAVAAAAPAPVVEPAKPLPPYVEAAIRRPKVPKFAIPVLAALPVWALIYAGAMAKSSSVDPQLKEGASIYAANCSGCHGASGEGGTGRPLNEVLKTFPDLKDHVEWVTDGDRPNGTPYGDPKRAGGQRIAGSDGFTTKMPGFKGTLTADEIAAVVRYERVEFGGEAASAEASSSSSSK